MSCGHYDNSIFQLFFTLPTLNKNNYFEITEKIGYWCRTDCASFLAARLASAKVLASRKSCEAFQLDAMLQLETHLVEAGRLQLLAAPLVLSSSDVRSCHKLIGLGLQGDSGGCLPGPGRVDFD